MHRSMWRSCGSCFSRKRRNDFVIGMGESHSVREFVEEAFSYVGLDWEAYVEIDPQYFRPLEVNDLRSDPSKARKVLQWQPTIGFGDLMRIMVDADLQALDLDSPGDGERLLREKFQDWHQWGDPSSTSRRAERPRSGHWCLR